MIELLAPAGSREALVAAVKHGASAVYLAGRRFGARAFAQNFDDDALCAAVQFAHTHHVAVHVAVNTIVGDDELDDLAAYLRQLGALGVDAILVQDLGVLRVARRTVPQIPIHASTQMTIHNLSGVQMAEQLGCSRVVLSRELSLAEIRRICAGTTLEVEVFVHGARCVCWSGQCLLSSLIGGRSGNRGQCAQPCRLPYRALGASTRNEHPLSPPDLCALRQLPQLIEAGVASLKIEGRMKPANYVATVTGVYREALDACFNGDDFDLATAERRLAKVFNRGYTGLGE